MQTWYSRVASHVWDSCCWECYGCVRHPHGSQYGWVDPASSACRRHVRKARGFTTEAQRTQRGTESVFIRTCSVPLCALRVSAVKPFQRSVTAAASRRDRRSAASMERCTRRRTARRESGAARSRSRARCRRRADCAMAEAMPSNRWMSCDVRRPAVWKEVAAMRGGTMYRRYRCRRAAVMRKEPF